MDAVSLRVVAKDDMQTIWKMQIEAFSDLLHKYQDYDMSPGESCCQGGKSNNRKKTRNW